MKNTTTGRKAGAKSYLDQQQVTPKQPQENKPATAIELSVIAEELHDNISQVLGTVKLFLEVACVSEERRVKMLTRARELVTECISSIRKLSLFIISYELKGNGLPDTMRALVADLSLATELQVECILNDELAEKIGTHQQVMFFRIIQEQVHNVLKHAQATHLHIRFVETDEQVQLYIQDNGIGFNVQRVKFGLGLVNINKRAKVYDGKVTINSRPGKGTSLVVQVPKQQLI